MEGRRARAVEASVGHGHFKSWDAALVSNAKPKNLITTMSGRLVIESHQRLSS